MVCKTLTVSAVVAPNIYIDSLVIVDARGYPLPEPYMTTEGDAARLQVTLKNIGDADGWAYLEVSRDGVVQSFSALGIGIVPYFKWRVNASATETVTVWNAYDSSVGVHELCVELVDVTSI